MSKCWYCNNELTTGDNPKHFGICNKCYDEMFKSGDTIIRSFTNKIKDLETKLAEKEKEIEELKGKRLKFYNDDVRRTQVINGVHFDIEQLLVFSEYVEHEKLVISNRDKEIEELKQQLAEKDEEIAYLTKQVKKFNNEAQKYFEDAYCNDFHKRDKISFAVEQLEQIRKEFEIKFKGCKWEDKMLVGKFCNITNEIIDNQIKSLK